MDGSNNLNLLHLRIRVSCIRVHYLSINDFSLTANLVKNVRSVKLFEIRLNILTR